jgi:Family of unknown function (DUF6172)
VSLPEGVDFWDFACKVGADKESALPMHLAEVTAKVDALAKEGHASVYVEVEATHGHRVYEARQQPADDSAAQDH